jgi:hypothetical protein
MSIKKIFIARFRAAGCQHIYKTKPVKLRIMYWEGKEGTDAKRVRNSMFDEHIIISLKEKRAWIT